MKHVNILAISDTQEPFAHKDAIAFVKHVQRTYFKGKRHVVVHVGDEVDQHTLAQWDADPDGMSGGDEVKAAKERLKLWYKAFPSCLVVNSNHTRRAWKKARGAGIPSAFMRTVAEAYDAPAGWKWAQSWVIGGIKIEHGENVSGATAALKAAQENRMPTIIGHQHGYGGVIYQCSEKDTIWGLNTGCLIDLDAYAFAYSKTYRNKPTLGCGVVVDGVPFFVPMLLDKRGRWIGRKKRS